MDCQPGTIIKLIGPHDSIQPFLLIKFHPQARPATVRRFALAWNRLRVLPVVFRERGGCDRSPGVAVVRLRGWGCAFADRRAATLEAGRDEAPIDRADNRHWWIVFAHGRREGRAILGQRGRVDGKESEELILQERIGQRSAQLLETAQQCRSDRSADCSSSILLYFSDRATIRRARLADVGRQPSLIKFLPMS